MKRTLILAMAVLCAVALTSTIQAGVVSSSPFSLGYGYTGSRTWNTGETSSANTETTIGDFTFLPTLVSTHMSSWGPRFTNRVLTTNQSTSGYCGNSGGFGVTIAGSWAGDDPPDADPDPDYHIQLNITGISIYFAGRNWGATEIAFQETTVGHEATSDYTSIPSTPVEGYKGDGYIQLAWDPADYATEGIAFTRGFDLVTDAGFCAPERIPGDANRDRVVDDKDASILAAHWQQPGGWGDGDFNEDGVVNDQDASIMAAHWGETREGSAAPVPEPSVLVLLFGAGLIGLLARARRRR
jgi:hypothetical protein